MAKGYIPETVTKSNFVSLILLMLFLIQALQLLIWIREDDNPPAWDQSWNAMISVNRYNQFLGRTKLTTEQIEKIYPIFDYANNFYPPLYHISTIPFYFFFGVNYDSALMTNIPFFVVLILSSFFVGKKVHSTEAGLITAFIVSTIPGYSFLMRDYLVDFSFVSMICLGFALLLYTEHFGNLKYSIFFGITFGLGMLVKWTYVVYLILPIFFSLLIFFKYDIYRDRNYSSIKNILFPLLIAFFIASTWYDYEQLKIVVPLLKRFSLDQGGLEGDPEFSSISGLTYYFFVIISGYSFLYFMLFIGGAILVLIYAKKREYCLTTLLNILVIYVLLTVVSNKDGRYITPIYVFFASISGNGICLVGNKKMRYGILTLIVLLGLTQNIAYNSGLIDVDYRLGRIPVFNSKGRYPRSSSININKILSTINISSNEKPFSVCIISETEDLNDVNLPYYSFTGGYPTEYMIGNGCNPLQFDYAVVGPVEKTWRSNLFERSKSILEENLNEFELIYSAGRVAVYKRASK